MKTNKVTIYDIAEKTNFSVGTVHRALNNKGRISKKTKQYIIDTAQALGYKVNIAAQGLRRSTIKIGAVLSCPVEEYVDAIIKGLSSCGEELEKYNVETIIKKVDYSNSTDCVKKSCQYIQDLSAEGCNGIILFISCTTDEAFELSNLVKDLSQKNISFATVANDILGKDSVLHVGINAYMAGSMAAEILELSCKNQKVSLLINSKTSPVNREYVNGFMDYSKNQIFSDIVIYEHFDDPKIVETVTTQMLDENPDLKGIYMTTASSALACSCIENRRRTNLSIITTDLLKETPKLLKNKVANATIFQNPFKQGKTVAHSLYNYIIFKTNSGIQLINPHIILSSNLESYLFDNE